MNDAGRVRLAKQSGRLMLGPVERQRCLKHPTSWVSFRWSWLATGDISSSNPQVVRQCTQCVADELREDMEAL